MHYDDGSVDEVNFPLEGQTMPQIMLDHKENSEKALNWLESGENTGCYANAVDEVLLQRHLNQRVLDD